MYAALTAVRAALDTALDTGYLVDLVVAVGDAFDAGATDDDLELVVDMPFGDWA
jgi:hypothetical protein